jgi:hypothetical protein
VLRGEEVGLAEGELACWALGVSPATSTRLRLSLMPDVICWLTHVEGEEVVCVAGGMVAFSTEEQELRVSGHCVLMIRGERCVPGWMSLLMIVVICKCVLNVLSKRVI